MNYFPLNDSQLEWQERTRDLAQKVVGPRSAGYDRDGQFPQESLDSLKKAGLWALRISKEYGGLGSRPADHLPGCGGDIQKMPFNRHVLQDAPRGLRNTQPPSNPLPNRAIRQTLG